MSNDPAIQAIYNRVADWFANWVETTFETEDSLKAVWEEHHRTQPFDRTSNWNRVLFNELTKIWKTQGTGVEGATLTGFDRNEILKALADRLDYNLFTQVLMNLQDFGSLQYACSEAEVVTELLKEKWEGRKPSIFDAKPKMFKEAKDDTEAEYNRDLASSPGTHRISATASLRRARLRRSRTARTSPCSESAAIHTLSVRVAARLSI
jgi:hypothetical protein